MGPPFDRNWKTTAPVAGTVAVEVAIAVAVAVAVAAVAVAVANNEVIDFFEV